MKKRRKRIDGVALNERMLMAFVDWFFTSHEEDPAKYKRFWDQHREVLMAWWLEDTPLPGKNYHCIEHHHYGLEGRLFARPKMWWSFVPTQPKKHYMRINVLGHEECLEEDTYDYLKRTGLLTEREKQLPAPEPEQYPYEEGPIEEISPYRVASNALVCNHWKCHLNHLNWETRLRLAYRLEVSNLANYLPREEYLQANEGNPFAGYRLRDHENNN